MWGIIFTLRVPAREVGWAMNGSPSIHYQPLSIADLEVLELPPRQDIVEGGLLVAGSLTLFSAREKSGKTMLTTDLACAIACEEPFLDRAVTPGPIVFVALEENIREVRDRFLKRLDHRRDAPVHVLPANGYDDTIFRIDIPECIGALARMIDDLNASVVVIDTMHEAHHLRENESDDMGRLTRPLRQIAHDTNCAIFLLHHMNKEGGSRGSTSIAAGCDQLWNFQRTDADNDAGPPVGRLTVEGRFGPKQVMGIRLGDGLRWVVDNAVTVQDQTTRSRILATLGNHVDGLTAADLATATGGRLKSIQNELSRLLQEDPCPIVASGTGTKGNPRRYITRTPRLFQENSGHLTEDSPHSLTLPLGIGDFF